MDAQRPAETYLVYVRRRRVQGMQFFSRHPNDPRRWEWFRETAGVVEQVEHIVYDSLAKIDQQTPLSPIDSAARTRWEPVYHQWRSAFLASSVADSLKAKFRDREIQFGNRALRSDLTRNVFISTARLREFQQRILEYGNSIQQGGLSAVMLAANYIDYIGVLATQPPLDRVGTSVLREFIQGMLASRDTALRHYGRTRIHVLELKRRPTQLKLVRLDGHAFDVARYRGKVVVLDFWMTSCGSCIGAFPRLKELYQEYHPQGLEIIGISLDAESHRQLVSDVIAKHGLPWPQAFAGDAPGSKYYRSELGIVESGHTAVIGCDGRLVTNGWYTNDALLRKQIMLSLAQCSASRTPPSIAASALFAATMSLM